MKKNYLRLISSFVVSLLVITGCQKHINEPQSPAATDPQTEESQSRSDQHGNNNECRLVNLDWSAGGAGIWQYHYNNKGLANKWAIDYGDGAIIDEKIYYNKNDQIIKADEDYFGSDYVYRFFYTGKRLTRVTRTSVEFPEQVMDFRYTYNNKGQNTRQDDDINDEHVLMYYDAMGNCTRTDIYLGSDLWYSDNYTFNAPVRNPWLQVPGIETGFLSYGGTYATNKRFFTSNRTLIYDTDGTPFVFNDYDPSQTVIQTGRNNLPISARYYDRISQSPLIITFDYDNCGRGHGHGNDGGDHRASPRVAASSDKSASSLTIRDQVRHILTMRSKDRKEKITELRRQISKK